MFEVKYDLSLDMEYVCKVEDEATKNHHETDKNIQTSFMPENRGDKYCPVCTFKMYLSHLHPNNLHLWQTVNIHNIHYPHDEIWYTMGHLGKNPLSTFMLDLSKKIGLSKIDTNHSFRVTGASLLKRCKFSLKEIMLVTGHKSLQSLTIYQRVHDEKNGNDPNHEQITH